MTIDFSKYRTNDIERNLTIARLCPLDIMVTGVTGAGKSTTLNALFQKTVAKIGDGVDPETMELCAYRLNNLFRIWDTPGLGDGVSQDMIHGKKLNSLLNKTYCLENHKYGFIDVALVVIEGSNRDLGPTYHLLNDHIVPNIQRNRILVVINQADVAMKGRHWNNELRCPDETLKAFLDEQAYTVQARVKEATGVSIRRPICYSAEYGYGVREVFDFIVDNMPKERRALRAA
ncbi:MAG: 50S ribosome-binding GTPase [Victivallales bacterium]|nr:50S ribosome-binding GTPase [Victivallales bacterium]